MLSLSAGVTVIWFIIVNLFANSFSSFLNLDQKYINAMLIYLLFLPAVNLFLARERYLFEYKKTVLTSMILAIGTSLLSVLFVLTFPNRLTGRIFGAVSVTVVLGIFFYIYFIQKGKKIRTQYWKYAIPICLPYIPHLLSLTLLNSMDRVMITKWCGPEDNALYSLAYTCSTLVTLLMTSMNSAFAPWVGEKLANDQPQEIRKFSKYYILGFSFLAIGIMAIAPEVLYVLGGKGYMEAKYVMTPIAMGCVCQFLYTLFVNLEQFKKKTIGMAIASVVAAAVNYVLNYFFIPRIGYLAAAYTTLIGYFCLLAIHMFVVYRLGLKDVYSYKLIALIVLAGSAFTVLITLLYSYNIIRYIFIGIYIITAVIVIIKNKEKLIQIIKRS